MNDFPSTLIIGENYLPLLKSLGHESIQNPDLFIIDDNTGYKIENIRQINNFLQNLPYSHQNKIVLIKNIENQVLLEGLLTICLYTNVEEKKDGTAEYSFLTNRFKKFPAKSPAGMFDEIKIESNLQLVVDKVKEYYK